MWSREQEEALDKVGRWLRSGNQQVFRIFGYAGTGKTTLAKHIAANVGGNVLFGAYTGKAAHVLQKRGCHGARTIHSLIYISRDKGKARLLELEKEMEHLLSDLSARGLNQLEIEAHKKYIELNEQMRLERENLAQPYFVLNLDSEVKAAELVIIDECSMVDGRMGEDLLSFGTKVLVLGDPAQLPPVKGSGYFTEGVQPDVMLTEIHRQARESSIIRLATELRNKEKPTKGEYGPDCRVITLGDTNPELVLSVDQIIVGRNRTKYDYNKRIRRLLNFEDPMPIESDRVVCLRNNHELGIQNGGIYCVQHVGGVMDNKVYMLVYPEDVEDLPIEVSCHTLPFLGKRDDIPYWDRKEAEEFEFGYAITGHKSQGSQWKRVMVFDESFCFRADKFRWAYTAATRAAEDLTWVLM